MQNIKFKSDFKDINWKTSKACTMSSCVQIAKVDGKIAIADSKQENSPVLFFTKKEWDAFTAGIQNGDFE